MIKQLTETISVLSRRVEELERKKAKKDRKKEKKMTTIGQEADQDEEGLNLEYETGSDMEVDERESTAAAAAATAVAAAVTTTSQAKVSAPKPLETGSQVGGAKPKFIAPQNSVKRQHTLTDLTLPSKKTSDPSQHSNPKQPPPRFQINKTGQSGSKNSK